MSKALISIALSLFIVGSLSGCVKSTLVSDKCTENNPAENQNCNKTDAAIYVAAAILEGPDKGQMCNDMSGKAKQDYLAQQQALKESLEKHARK